MRDKTEDRASPKRETLQLHRLQRMADVVYAIIIWRCFMFLPRPTAEQWNGVNISAFLGDNIGSFMIVFIVIVFTIIYWLQSNVLLGNLRDTDGRHTILSILQLFFLLIFLVSLRLHIELGASNETRVLESTAAALVGILGGWGWAYAAKNNRLLLPEVTKEYAYQVRYRILAEPITAIITIPMAFFGPIIWEISWFSYPVVVFLLKKLTRWKMAKTNMTSTIFLIFFLVCSLTGNTFGNEISSSPYSGPLSIGSASFSENSDFAVPPDLSGSMPVERKNQPAEEFSQGYQNWQAYGSIACCDHGKGEMYAFHIGYGYFFYDDFSVNFDVFGSYVRSGIDSDGAAIGLDMIFRRHQFKSRDNLWTLYIEAGSGLQQQSTNYAGSRKFNFRLLGGAGATFRMTRMARFTGGMRYLHISDAGIEGGGGGFDGFQFYAGSMFSF